MVAAAAAAAAVAATDAATGGSGSNGVATLQLQLAAQALPVLQQWAGQAQLQSLLQACLRQAAGPAVTDTDSMGDGTGPPPSEQQRQRMCRQLLLRGDLLEQRRLAALLPAAAAAELGALLRQANKLLMCP